MQIHRGHLLPPSRGRALTIGNFDGVHRGHQAMLALLRNEAQHRGMPSCVVTFEPHPRDHFARKAGTPEAAPARIATLRDKLSELERCGIDEVAVLRFDDRLAALSPDAFVDDMLLKGAAARYVLVGDDFRYGARRVGDYARLDATGQARGFDVARMLSYEVHGQRVSSSTVRSALAGGHMDRAAALLGRPYAISGHVVRGRQLGRELGFRTLNLRFPHAHSAAHGIFVVRVQGLGGTSLDGVASLGVRPSVEHSGQVLLETHCLQWPAQWSLDAGYGHLMRVELLHKLHDERQYESINALREGIAADVAEARCWLVQQKQQQNNATNACLTEQA